MGKTGFIAYDPDITRDKFNGDMVAAIYYKKLLWFDEILHKDSEGFFSRSIDEISLATCIKRRQQDRVRRWLETHSFIITVLKIPEGKIAPQVHYKIVDKNRVK